MPELTPEKVAKLDAMLRANGHGSVYDPANRERILAKFVDKETDKAVKMRNFAALSPPGRREFEASLERPARPEDAAQGATFKGGLPGRIAGSFATGVQEAIKPVGDLLAKAPGVKLAKAGLEAIGVPIGEKYKEYEGLVRQGQEAAGASGAAGKYSRIAGNIAPMLAIPGAAFSTPARAAGTGALIGGAGTEGGVAERAKAAAFGALSFGFASKANRLLQPAAQRAAGALLARGVPGQFVPRALHAATDAAAFTSVAALEQKIAPHHGQQPASIAELFITNLATIGMAHGMGAAMPSAPGAKFAKGRQIVTLQKGFEKAGGLGGMGVARQEALASGQEAALVHAAYLEAARGKQITPAEANLMARGGAAAVRRKIAPERVADLFAEDQPKLAPEPVAAEIGVVPSERAKVEYEARAAVARTITETQKSRADAVIESTRLRRMAAEMEAEGQRQTEIAAKEAAKVVIRSATGGKGADVPAAQEALGQAAEGAKARPRASMSEADYKAEAAEKGIERKLGEEYVPPAGKKPGREVETVPPAPSALGPDFEAAATAAKTWKAKAADARRRADEIELRAETEADFALDRAKRLKQRLLGQDPEADTVAKIVPQDSVGSRKLRDTTAEDALITVKRLADEQATVSPDQEINIRPGGTDVLAADLAKTPPTEPGSDFARANAGGPPPDIKAPKPWDYFRMLLRTAPKLLGEKLGRTFYEKSVEASWKTRHAKHLIRKAAADKFRKWSSWLEVLNPADRQAAINRFVDLTEQGRTAGAHPIETEFLTFWNRIMKGYANAIERTSGKPLALKGRYLSHIFETLEAGTDASAKRAAQQILNEWRGSAAAGPGGSRFLHARQSSRKDFVRDVFFLFDAYVNSMTPALHWKPVANWLTELRKPGGEFETIMAEKMKATGGDIREAKKLRGRMQAAEDFLKKHVAAGMGRQESWFGIADALDAGIASALSRVGFKPKAPYRTLMRAYTYAQYVGGLGLNVGSALRNLTQGINTISEVGPTWWGKASTLLAEVGMGGRPDINRLLRQSHINDSSLERDVRTNVQSLFGRRMATLGKGVSDATMGLFVGAEWLNRSTAYLAAYLKAKSRGLGEGKARSYAREVLGRTQFDYTPGLGGLIYNGPFTHALFQFTRFPVYQMDWLGSVMGKAATGNAKGMLPGDLAVAPALRLALSTLVASPLMAALGLDFNDSFGIGGVPEPVKFAATRGSEEIGQMFGGFEGRMAGRRAMRRVGLEPYETKIGEASERMFGPVYQQLKGLLIDLPFSSPEERRNVVKSMGPKLNVLAPGLAVHRFLRFLDEYDEKQVRNSRTGEVMFPITDGDAWSRLVGINTPDVIGGYERIRDQKLRETADAGMRANLYADVREEYRSLKAAKDPDAAEKAAAKFFAGLREIYTETGIRPMEDPYAGFRENVIQRVEVGEVTTKEQRGKPVIDRSNVLGPSGVGAK